MHRSPHITSVLDRSARINRLERMNRLGRHNRKNRWTRLPRSPRPHRSHYRIDRIARINCTNRIYHIVRNDRLIVVGLERLDGLDPLHATITSCIDRLDRPESLA